MRRLLVLSACMLVALAGCGDDDGGGGSKALTVSAAASLKGALTDYGNEFDAARVRLSFAGSDELAAQIRKGVRPDVFAAANTKLPEALYAEGLVEKPVVFAGNELVVAVPADSKVTAIEDLGKPGTKIAIGSESVPVGEYTREVLGRLPPATSKAILDNVRSNEPDVKGVVGKVSLGAVDAGLVYVTDVEATDGQLKAIELPARLRPTVAYGMAIVKGARNPDGARAFVRRPARRRRRADPARGGLRETAVTGFRLLVGVSVAVALTFLTLPIVAIFVDTGPADLIASLGDPESLDALKLSLETTSIAIVVILVVGTPAAYGLATRDFRGRSLVVTLIELPLVLPPAVAGIGLLAALGPQGVFGAAVGDSLVLQTAGVVVALVFVSAPFYLRQAQAAFAGLDPRWLEASRTLGAGEARTFARIAVPAAMPGLVAGLALAWGRALGEFGATLMFAGSFRGVTQTVPLAIYDQFATDFPAALALSAVLVCVSAALLGSVKLVTGGGPLGVAAR